MNKLLLSLLLLISIAGFSQVQKSMRDYTPRAPQLGDTIFTNRGTTGTSTFLQLKSLYFAGTTLQYMRGDGSLATFPTDNAGFTNGAGYLTNTTGDVRYALSAHTHTFASLTSKPTTLSGYGITDAYPLTGNPSGFLISSDIAGKVDKTTTISVNGANPQALSSNINLVVSGGTATTDASLLTSGTLADARLSSNVSITLTPTAIKTAAYTAAANDFVKTDASSGTVPITLPTAPADKTRIGVKMIAVSSSNTTTIAVGGSDVFNKAGGSTTITLSLLNQGLTFQYESATGIWSVVWGDIPLSQLDARFATATQVNAKLSSANYIVRETPTGSTNGSNTIFTLANSPITGKEEVYLNGLQQEPSTDYTISGATITMIVAPRSTDKIRVTYIY